MSSKQKNQSLSSKKSISSKENIRTKCGTANLKESQEDDNSKVVEDGEIRANGTTSNTKEDNVQIKDPNPDIFT